MKRTALIIVVLTVIFICPSYARAAGWTQRWQQSDTEIWNGEEVGQFDQMAIWATKDSGTSFQDPAFSDFIPAGWTTSNDAGNLSARAFSASPFTYIQFDMNYATEFGVADFLYMCAYQGELRQRQHITFDTTTQQWYYPPYAGSDAEWQALGGGDPAPIPEPSTMALFGGPLLMFIPYIKRR